MWKRSWKISCSWHCLGGKKYSFLKKMLWPQSVQIMRAMRGGRKFLRNSLLCLFICWPDKLPMLGLGCSDLTSNLVLRLKEISSLFILNRWKELITIYNSLKWNKFWGTWCVKLWILNNGVMLVAGSMRTNKKLSI